MNRKIYKQLAKKHGVSVEEIKRDMQAAINITYENPSEAAKNIMCDGRIPTVDEFMHHTTAQINCEENERKTGYIDNSLKTVILKLFDNIRDTIFTSEAALAEFKSKDINHLHDYHMGMGLYLRNNVLTTEKELYKLFQKNGIEEPDDMSAEILCIWHIALQEK